MAAKPQPGNAKTPAAGSGSQKEDNLQFITVPNLKLPELIKAVKSHITLNDHAINLIYAKGTVHATAEKCPHKGGPLHEGEIEDLPKGGLCIRCPWHHYEFNIETGVCVAPADGILKLKIYPVKIINDEIKIGFEKKEATTAAVTAAGPVKS